MGDASAGGGGGQGSSSWPGKGAPVSTSNYANNLGKNTVGLGAGRQGTKKGANGAVSGSVRENKPNQAGDDHGKKRRKSLYGFQSKGPERAKIPAGNKVPRKEKAISVNVPTADPDRPAPVEKDKINHKVMNVSTNGCALSHSRVGKAQTLASFGSHRRSLNWVQPGTHKQLLGPFSDHLRLKHRDPLVS
jgi:hypothetical protein